MEPKAAMWCSSAVSDDASNLAISPFDLEGARAALSRRLAVDSAEHAQNSEREHALVERAKADPGAFAAIYRAHYTGIVGYLYRRVGHEHTAEDLATETFIKAMRSLPRYQSRGLPLKSWLLRIATNEAHRWARRNRRRSGSPPRNAGHEAPAHTARPDDERRRIVQEAFLALPAKWQDVLALHHLEGLGMEQAAMVLRCRAGTVKSRLSRARDGLRRELERRRYTHE